PQQDASVEVELDRVYKGDEFTSAVFKKVNLRGYIERVSHHGETVCLDSVILPGSASGQNGAQARDRFGSVAGVPPSPSLGNRRRSRVSFGDARRPSLSKEVSQSNDLEKLG
ncbi:hypothetical protein OXX79_014405, partial [Metschnikowia pulcherrima]